MLVLTRKTDETIKIGEDIEITVLRIRGNSVRLGIQAPKEVHVMRGELQRKQNLKGETSMDVKTARPNTKSKQSSAAKRTSESLPGRREISLEKNPTTKVLIGRTKRTTPRLSLSEGPLSHYLEKCESQV